MQFVIEAWKKSLARDKPGGGMNAADDGAGPHVKVRSIPNVSTERLRRAVEFGHGQIHTAEGLHDLDGPRRSMIEQGMRLQALTHELTLRGEAPGDCKHCWGSRSTTGS